jgi:hypothetical protein
MKRLSINLLTEATEVNVFNALAYFYGLTLTK